MAIDLQLRYSNGLGGYVYPELHDEGRAFAHSGIWLRDDPEEHARRGCLHSIPHPEHLCANAYAVHSAGVWRSDHDIYFIKAIVNGGIMESFNVKNWIARSRVDDKYPDMGIGDARYYIRAFRMFSDYINELNAAGKEPQIRFI